MLISPELNAAFNEHIGQELFSSHQYLNIAADLDDRALRLLSKMFYTQAEEEHGHALKFINYITETNGRVEIPAVPAPKADFDSVQAMAQLALDYEMEITRRINDLMAAAVDAKDYAAQEFLRDFVKMQVQEVKAADDLLKIVKEVGERNIIMVEGYLAHNG